MSPFVISFRQVNKLILFYMCMFIQLIRNTCLSYVNNTSMLNSNYIVVIPFIWFFYYKYYATPRILYYLKCVIVMKAEILIHLYHYLRCWSVFNGSALTSDQGNEDQLTILKVTCLHTTNNTPSLNVNQP